MEVLARTRPPGGERRAGAVGHRCKEPWCCRVLDPDAAIGLLARVRERQGRIDDLRAYACSEPHGHAARRLAGLLQELGDIDGDIAVYRHPAHRSRTEPDLAAEAGRTEKARARAVRTGVVGGPSRLSRLK
ncbi:hypothetical protein [Streptomyces sp. NPDC047976]|uniref:hypothetical protein n=1 Tax=Streptomyces sp. NPDC047976 TaxID=3155746 RepID=UPI0034184D03